MLNDKEKLIWDYINDTIKNHGYSPSVRDIKEALSIKSTSTVHSYLERLEKKGYIRRETGKSRTLRVESIVNQPSRMAKIPILSHITVGSPALAAENFTDYIDFPMLNRLYPSDMLFALKMKDDSMSGAGILSGDIAVIIRADNITDGDFAAVIIDNQAVIRKYLSDEKNNAIRLCPENDRYDFIAVDNGSDELIVLGKVVSVIRFY